MRVPLITNIFEGLNDLVFPALCIHCEAPLTDQSKQFHLCTQCQTHLKPNLPPFCIKCSHPLTNQSTPICSNCKEVPPTFDFAFSACIYNDFLKKLMHEYKYHGQTLWRHIFIHQMIHFIENNHIDIQQFDFIIPIPLHQTRNRERGYNQSLLLAEGLSQYYKIPINKTILKRIRYTKEQASLSRNKRLLNLKNAFRIKNPQIITNKSVLIVDDLLTTGTTASEAANTFKNSGAKITAVFTLATVAASRSPYNQSTPFKSDIAKHTLL